MKQVKLAVGAALLGLSASANAGIIDLFTTHQASITDTIAGDSIGEESFMDTAGVDIIGGERDLYVETIFADDGANGDGTGATATGASIGVGPSAASTDNGKLTFSNGDLTDGLGVVQWDGNDDSSVLDTTGLGGLDLTDGGDLNSFQLDVLFADQGFWFEVGLYDMAGGWTKAELLSSDVPSPMTSYISFDDFLACGAISPIFSITCQGGGVNPVDVTNLGAIELRINTQGTTSVDLSLDNVTTVPEPSVLGLMGAGLLAGGLVGRARSKKSKAA